MMKHQDSVMPGVSFITLHRMSRLLMWDAHTNHLKGVTDDVKVANLLGNASLWKPNKYCSKMLICQQHKDNSICYWQHKMLPFLFPGSNFHLWLIFLLLAVLKYSMSFINISFVRVVKESILTSVGVSHGAQPLMHPVLSSGIVTRTSWVTTAPLC